MTERKKPILVAIYGAGAMGTVLGAFLTEGARRKNACVSVDLISRNKAHISAMKDSGAKIRFSASGDLTSKDLTSKDFTVKVRALYPEEMSENYDVIFLMTKQKDNGKTVSFLQKYLAKDGIICTAQNGLPERSVAEVIGAEKTFGAVCAWGATFTGEGRAELTSVPEAMSVLIGAYSESKTGDQSGERTADKRCDTAENITGNRDFSQEKLSLLREILSLAGDVAQNPDFVKVTDNLSGARWSKLCINAAFSGLSVMTGLTFGEIASRGKTRRAALKILSECFSVANASHIGLEKMQGRDMEKLLGEKGIFGRAKAWILLPIAMKKHKKLLSGMLKDLEKGRKCEIDYIDGAVSRAGRDCGVATPFCDKIVEIVHKIENGLYEISPYNVDFFLKEEKQDDQ